MRSLWLVMTLLTSSAWAQNVCSPFDKLPDAQLVDTFGRLPDAGRGPEYNVCCKEGVDCTNQCPACRSVSRPVDVLSGFAWIDRQDIRIVLPWGPPLEFTRHYSTAEAQRNAHTALGLGWSHNFTSHLQLFSASPASKVVLRDGTSTGEEYLWRAGAYVSVFGGSTLTWEPATQRYVAERPDGTRLVFDGSGKLTSVVADDGGELTLRYAGFDAACTPTASLPADSLCRVEAMFGRSLHFHYNAVALLSGVSIDSRSASPYVSFTYAGDSLDHATRPEGDVETYQHTPGFVSWAAGVTVRLVTKAIDADGKVAESFDYSDGLPGAPAFDPTRTQYEPMRVVSHSTPEGTFTWSYAYFNTRDRRTTVSSNGINRTFRFRDGQLISVCDNTDDSRFLPDGGFGPVDGCDITNLRTYAYGSDVRNVACEAMGDGTFVRTERDARQRLSRVLPGLDSCTATSPVSEAHAATHHYVGASSRHAGTSWPSVDSSAPAGTRAFIIDDYTPVAMAVAPHCGNASCQTPEVYNQGAVGGRVNQRVELGRTLLDAQTGRWGLQVKQTKYGYDALGRLESVDGPRTDVTDITQYAWSPMTAWQLDGTQQPSGATTRYANHHLLGSPRTVVDSAGKTWSYEYDGLGRWVSATAPGRPAASQARLPSGRLDKSTSPHGTFDAYEYDADGNVSKVLRKPSLATTDVETRFTFVDKRLTRQERIEAGSSVRNSDFGYDSQGRQAAWHSSTSESWGFDNVGRMDWRANAGTSDGLGGQVDTPSHRYHYDVFGRLVRVEQHLEGAWQIIVEFTWDTQDNLSSFVDARGVAVTYRHDDFGRTVEVESPDFGTTRYVYDEADNVIVMMTPSGTTHFKYDADNRLTEKTLSGGSIERYGYSGGPMSVANCTGLPLPPRNSDNRLSSVEDAVGTWYFGYTDDGLLAWEGLVARGTSCVKALQWARAPNGLISSMTYPSGAVVEFGYPAPGAANAERPSSLTLVVGTTRSPLLTDLKWEAGELTEYASAGSQWRLRRNAQGLPSSVRAVPSQGREQTFSLNNWGLPRTLQEVINGTRSTDANFKHVFSNNEMPALTEASGPTYAQQVLDYLYSGDRARVNGASYCYESGTHRLTLIEGEARYGWTSSGKVARKVTPQGVQSFCWGDDELSRLVGPSGEVTDFSYDFRRRRTVEWWPLNNLRQDFRVDDASRLLVESSPASLTAQFPRATREFVWLGPHPVAVLESTEAEDGSISHRGVTFLRSGQLGEVLVELDSSGAILRNHVYQPFGRRQLVGDVVSSTQDASVFQAGIFQSLSINPPDTATSFRLHFLDAALQGCQLEVFEMSGSSIVSYGVAAIEGEGSFSPWFAGAPNVLFDIQGCAVSGVARIELQSRATPLQSVSPPVVAASTYRLGAPTILDFDVSLSGCDELRGQDDSGAVLWKVVGGGHGGFIPTTRAVTTVLPSGDVSFGFFAGACGSLSGTSAFTLRGARRVMAGPSSPPVPMLLPGQKLSASGLVDNWHRWLERDTGRYLSPEPLLQSPEYVGRLAQRGGGAPTYGYAANNPLKYIDRDGRTIYPDLADPRVMALVKKLRGTPCGQKLWDYLDGLEGVDFWIFQDDLPPNPDLTWPAGDTARIGNDIRIRLDFFNMMVGNESPLTALGHEFGHGLLLSIPYPIRYWDPRAKGRVWAQHEAFARELARCIQEEKCGK